MPDAVVDFRSSAAYVLSFAALQNALKPRDPGRVIEIQAAFTSGEITLFMEAQSLYLIGFQNDRGQILALEGDGQPFGKYLSDKYPKQPVSGSGINAKYGTDTWGLKMVKETLDQTLMLKTFNPGDTRITDAKKHIDRMAFAIAEAARFIPIRCAIACVLHDDYKFLAVLERLSDYSKSLVQAERKVDMPAPGQTLSKRDANLRDLYPKENIHVFELNSNKFEALSKTERWLKLLTAAEKDLSLRDRERLRSLPESHYAELTLGDFQNLLKNWSKLSASKDMYIHEIISEMHIRHTAGATPDDNMRFILEWH